MQFMLPRALTFLYGIVVAVTASNGSLNSSVPPSPASRQDVFLDIYFTHRGYSIHILMCINMSTYNHLVTCYLLVKHILTDRYSTCTHVDSQRVTVDSQQVQCRDTLSLL